MPSISPAQDIRIRSITSADIPKIRELHVSYSISIPPFPHSLLPQASLLPVTYPLSFYLQLLLHPSRICLLAYPHHSPTTPIAFISASITPPTAPSPRPRSRRPSVSATYTKPVAGTGSDPCTTVSSFEVVSDEPRVHITTLGVLPQYQREGLARKLVSEVVKKLRDTIAEPVTSSASSSSSTLVERSKSRSPTRGGMLVTAQLSIANVPTQKLYEVLGMQPDDAVVRDINRNTKIDAPDAHLLIGRVPLK